MTGERDLRRNKFQNCTSQRSTERRCAACVPVERTNTLLNVSPKKVSAGIGLMLALNGAMAGIAFAQDNTITLQSSDKSLSLTGEFVNFDGSAFTINHPQLGRLIVSDLVGINCTGAACPDESSIKPETITVQGSAIEMDKLMPRLIEGFSKTMGADAEFGIADGAGRKTVQLKGASGGVLLEFVIEPASNSDSIASLYDGDADIVLLAERLVNSNLRGSNAETAIGFDGVVFITHPENPIRNLNAVDIGRILSGEATNWLEFDGENQEIIPFSLAVDSADRALIEAQILRPTRQIESADIRRWRTSDAMISAVEADPGAIGMVRRSAALQRDVNILDLRETCGLLSPPTDFRIKNRGYILSRDFHLYTKSVDISRGTGAFIEWVNSDAGQAFLEENRFVSANAKRMRLEDMGMMLIHNAAVEPEFNALQYVSMMKELRGSDRLSISYRFETGSSNLDAESVVQIDELAHRIEAGEFIGREIVLAGFADSVGNQKGNIALAQKRASEVTSILERSLSKTAVNDITLTPMNYGEMLPLSCNDTEIGRERNRRVEVWLR